LLKLFKKNYEQFLSPYQFGVGSQFGNETIIHFIEQYQLLHPDFAVVQTDIKNAYNTIKRCKIADTLFQTMPGLLPWFKATYQPTSKLWFEDSSFAKNGLRKHIDSAEGVQQGDSCAALFFCMGIHSRILRKLNDIISDKFKGQGIALGLIDDITIIAAPNVINQIWQILIDDLKYLGLNLNEGKCHIYNEDLAVIENVLPDSIQCTTSGLVVLGAPIGSTSFKHSYWTKEFEKYKTEIEKATKYKDKQAALIFLRMCLATKYNYFLRSCPVNDDNLQLTRIIDQNLCTGLSNILNYTLNLEDVHWLQSTLAAKYSGLGIQSAEFTHIAAYSASIIAVHQTIGELKFTDHYFINDVNKILENLRNISSVYHQIFKNEFDLENKLEPFEDILIADKRKLQKKFSSYINNFKYKNLWDRSTTDDRLRIDSASREGGVLITTIPKHDDLRIKSDLEFVERLSMRLGLPISYINEQPCTCNNNTNLIGADGYHLLSQCKFSSKTKIETHNAVRDTWIELARNAGYKVEREDNIFCQSVLGNSSKVKMDFVVKNYKGLSPLLADISVIDPRSLLSQNRNGRQIHEPGDAAAKREKEKIAKHAVLTANNDAVFKPLIIESFGRWGEEARKLFKELIILLQERTGAQKSSLTAYWRSRITFSLFKTAALGLRRRAQDININTPSSNNVWKDGVCEQFDYYRSQHCRV
jgi:hypothetical protein